MPDFELTIVRKVLQECQLTVFDVENEDEARRRFESNWGWAPLDDAMVQKEVSWPDIINIVEKK